MANILAVDDDRDLCALLRTALERDGHVVEVLHSGREVTERHCAWADCILLDVMMPGEDGFAACRRLRALTDCPILFLTARTEEADVLRGLGLGLSFARTVAESHGGSLLLSNENGALALLRIPLQTDDS